MRALALGARSNSRGVRADVRLGQRERAQHFAFRDGLQELVLLSVISEPGENAGDEIVDRDNGGGGAIARRNFLAGDGERGVVEPGAVPFLGNGDAVETHRGEPFQRFPGKVLFPVPARGVGRQLLLRKPPHRLPDFLVLHLVGIQTSSIAIAVASPPPMHRLAMPRFRAYLRSAPISVTRMRAPEAPIGCPSAQAPPCTFTLSCGRPCSFIAARVTTANASFTSYRSTLFALQPVRSKSFAIAPTGAVVNQPGSWECVAWPAMSASGARPRRSAVERRISTSAAAPSEIELELAAVTVPSWRNAGFSVGILSRLALNGCSSISMNFSSLPALTAIGVISQANQPSRFAFCALCRERIAKSSCASREN